MEIHGRHTAAGVAGLAADKEKPDAAATPAGPEALEFREDDSTLYENGILTLIPLDRLPPSTGTMTRKR